MQKTREDVMEPDLKAIREQEHELEEEDDRDRPMTQRDREIGDWVKGRGR